MKFLVIHYPDYYDFIFDLECLSQLPGNDTVIESLKILFYDKNDINEDDVNKKYEINETITNSPMTNKDITNNAKNDKDMSNESKDNEMANECNNKRYCKRNTLIH